MASRDATTSAPGATVKTGLGVGNAARRLATETKQAFKTTEFWSFAAVVVAILLSAALIKGGDTAGNATDEFIARQAWLYVAIVTGAYLVSRGLAKSGVRDPYTEDRGDDGDDR